MRPFAVDIGNTGETTNLPPRNHHSTTSRGKAVDRRYKLVCVFGARKYKPVAVKVRPVKTDLPDEFRVQRNIMGDPLVDMPKLNPHPRNFVPTGRFTAERKEIFDKNHDNDFLWEDKLKLFQNIMMDHESAFAWCPEEGGSLKHKYFPPVKMPVIPHEPYVERNIPIPPGIFDEVC